MHPFFEGLYAQIPLARVRSLGFGASTWLGNLITLLSDFQQRRHHYLEAEKSARRIKVSQVRNSKHNITL